MQAKVNRTKEQIPGGGGRGQSDNLVGPQDLAGRILRGAAPTTPPRLKPPHGPPNSTGTHTNCVMGVVVEKMREGPPEGPVFFPTTRTP